MWTKNVDGQNLVKTSNNRCIYIRAYASDYNKYHLPEHWEHALHAVHLHFVSHFCFLPAHQLEQTATGARFVTESACVRVCVRTRGFSMMQIC